MASPRELKIIHCPPEYWAHREEESGRAALHLFNVFCRNVKGVNLLQVQSWAFTKNQEGVAKPPPTLREALSLCLLFYTRLTKPLSVSCLDSEVREATMMSSPPKSSVSWDNEDLSAQGITIASVQTSETFKHLRLLFIARGSVFFFIF